MQENVIWERSIIASIEWYVLWWRMLADTRYETNESTGQVLPTSPHSLSLLTQQRFITARHAYHYVELSCPCFRCRLGTVSDPSVLFNATLGIRVNTALRQPQTYF